MSGHSKWANIKHKKGKADAERGKVFTKIGREIAIAVRDGGSDPPSTASSDVIAKAKASNMPNIKRSIAKAAGELKCRCRRDSVRRLCAGRRLRSSCLRWITAIVLRRIFAIFDKNGSLGFERLRFLYVR